MKYSETLPSDLSLSLRAPEAHVIATKRRSFFLVPEVVSAKLSTTSEARECFIQRKNSKKMQQMLLNYAYVVCTSSALSGDV